MKKDSFLDFIIRNRYIIICVTIVLILVATGIIRMLMEVIFTVLLIIGAIYLDGGFDNARKFVLKFILNDIENKQLFYDSKTILQEMVQERKDVTIEYVLVDSYGPDHDKTFEVEVRADNKVLGHGKGRTKKRAEQQAAYEAILSLKSGKC